jgi:hypothetical protein
MLIIFLLIVAIVLFVIASVPVATSRINLEALGLAFFAASFLVAHLD